MPVVVSDTSPVRALAHLGHLSILHDLFGEVLIPPAVVAELEQPRSKLAAVPVCSMPFFRVQTPQNRPMLDGLLLTLGPGEAEALTLAVEVHADAVLIDESSGRAVARRLGLLPLGVLGTLVRARRRDLVGPLAPLLDRLQGQLGFFISSSLRAEILKQAGE